MTNDAYPNAGRASGYTDEQGRPIGEDLINRVAVIVAGVQTTLLEMKVALRDEIAQQGDARRIQHNELRRHLDARHDAHSRELDGLGQKVEALMVSVQEVTARQGKSERQVGDLLKRMSASERDRADLRTRLDTIQDWIDTQPTPEQAHQLIVQLNDVTTWMAAQRRTDDGDQ